ncbi:Transporter, LysE family [Mycetohabitans rhizoxinica HKI 454]|uniref:Transporter, LysE family n=1 Tax=Mycetohabitans rhizoxinica (strain DSM 19002 / CIP 109453 / HKI 454) TaxID=882378 RepID=E5ALD7_MYCRK|nr:LysE family translocator [Mycetohabitans rhizoxinica]MCF7694741.1 LysE family translocator [Mycetohabitans sp. B2]MCG1046115.1 LysE family translocator [Mycetohabitans sp. B6]CBW73810.1 Transporter, LysE family [Mycetohabitans rhizoxinica HKI 454]
MTLHTWWFFVATVFIVSAIPGPNMLLMMSSGARYGLRRSSWAMAGCLSALVLMLSVSAAGLGVFLQAWPAMFNALRVAGAAYLMYLGIKAWRAPVESASHGAADTRPVERDAAHRVTRFAMFRTGFLVGASNPKALLFAAALLPQFINAAAPTWPQFSMLVPTFALIEVGWYMVYAGCGSRIGERLRSRSMAKAFNRLTGGAFVGFGALMVLVRH